MRKLPIAAAAVLCAALVLPGYGPAQAQSSPKRSALAGTAPGYAVAGHDLGAIPARRTVTARIYLGSRDPEAAAALARAVSDPRSPSHGRFLTPAQYRKRFGPTAAQQQAVTDWLTRSGLRITSSASHYVTVSGRASAMDVALSIGIHRYRTASGVADAPDRDASVPADLAGTVTAVSGLSAPAAASPASAQVPAAPVTPPAAALAASVASATKASHQAIPAADEAAACSDYLGQKTAPPAVPPVYGQPATLATCPYPPSVLRTAYHAGFAGASGRGRTIAIVDAYGSPVMSSDLQQFARQTGDQVPRPGQYREITDPAAWTTGNECASPDVWAGEQALDVETAHGYAPDANLLYVGASSCLDNDLMDAEAKVIDSRSADVISNSWAEIVHADPGHVTPAIVAMWNALFTQAAIEGIGIYFASGDCGDSSPEAAQTGANCDLGTTQAQADFPSGSAWVTSVGGTTLATGRSGRYRWETSMGDEVSILPGGSPPWAPIPGVFGYGGGGGRSDGPQPWYQRGVVPSTMASSSNGPRRVTPDVALEGDFALPVLVGLTTDGSFQLSGYGGTSAATPGFAAIQTDAEQRLGHAIGFANPLLYSLAGTAALHDVTASAGSTHGQPPTAVRDYGPDQGDLRYVLYTLGHDFGLAAAGGYDPATGLGSPSRSYLTLVGRRG